MNIPIAVFFVSQDVEKIMDDLSDIVKECENEALQKRFNKIIGILSLVNTSLKSMAQHPLKKGGNT